MVRQPSWCEVITGNEFGFWRWARTSLIIGTYFMRLVGEAAESVGLHHPESDRMEDHFCPHCCRHWMTAHLRRAGMRREFIQELRGDSRREAIDIYDHIDLKEPKEAYLACIPQLGI